MTLFIIFIICCWYLVTVGVFNILNKTRNPKNLIDFLVLIFLPYILINHKYIRKDAPPKPKKTFRRSF
jgi:hypothetical protein